jgi:hypothetical protein
LTEALGVNYFGGTFVPEEDGCYDVDFQAIGMKTGQAMKENDKHRLTRDSVGPVAKGVERLLQKKKINIPSLVAAASVLGGSKKSGLHALQAQARELLRAQYNAFRNTHKLGRKDLKKVPVAALAAGCPIKVLNWPAGGKSTFLLAGQFLILCI